MDYLKSLIPALVAAGTEIEKLGKEGNQITEQGQGFGDTEHDTEIKADEFMGDAIRRMLREEGFDGLIVTEGQLDDPALGDDSVIAYVDPLDASLDYVFREGHLSLPYTACITLVDCSKNTTPCFRDIIVAGLVDLRKEDNFIVYATRSEEGRYESFGVNGLRAFDRMFRPRRLPFYDFASKTGDIGSEIVNAEFYYPATRACKFYLQGEVRILAKCRQCCDRNVYGRNGPDEC
ncbi:MAG: hypothetical protein R3B41_00140 [Candidatus Doudnabacteria bacterium]